MQLQHNHEPESDEDKINQLNESTKLSIDQAIKKDQEIRKSCVNKDTVSSTTTSNVDLNCSGTGMVTSTSQQDKFTEKERNKMQEDVIATIKTAIHNGKEATKIEIYSYFQKILTITYDFQKNVTSRRNDNCANATETHKNTQSGATDAVGLTLALQEQSDDLSENIDHEYNIDMVADITDAELIKAADNVEFNLAVHEQSNESSENIVHERATDVVVDIIDQELISAADSVEFNLVLQEQSDDLLPENVDHEYSVDMVVDITDEELIKAADKVEFNLALQKRSDDLPENIVHERTSDVVADITDEELIAEADNKMELNPKLRQQLQHLPKTFEQEYGNNIKASCTDEKLIGAGDNGEILLELQNQPDDITKTISKEKSNMVAGLMDDKLIKSSDNVEFNLALPKQSGDLPKNIVHERAIARINTVAEITNEELIVAADKIELNKEKSYMIAGSIDNKLIKSADNVQLNSKAHEQVRNSTKIIKKEATKTRGRPRKQTEVKKISEPLAYDEKQKIEKVKTMMKWLLLPDELIEASMSNEYKIKLKDLTITGSTIGDSFMEVNVNIDLLKNYCTAETWKKIVQWVKAKRKKNIFCCGKCQKVCSERTVFCNCCYCWFDFDCVEVSRNPRTKYWFCPDCQKSQV